jgi:hypothetical protein
MGGMPKYEKKHVGKVGKICQNKLKNWKEIPLEMTY